MSTEMILIVGGSIVVVGVILYFFFQPAKTIEVQAYRATSSRKTTNKKGWRAPANYYFNAADELVDCANDNAIEDMLIIAELCGITDYVPGFEEATIDSTHVEDEFEDELPSIEVEEVTVAEPVSTEPVVPHPREPAPVGSPSVSYNPSGPYPHSDGGNEYDSGSDDSGSDD